VRVDTGNHPGAHDGETQRARIGQGRVHNSGSCSESAARMRVGRFLDSVRGGF
jgi:hypothetical protein